MNDYDLTDKEIGVLHTIVLHQKTTHQEIADAVQISMGTVRNTLYSIFAKLGAKNLAHAILIYLHSRNVDYCRRDYP